MGIRFLLLTLISLPVIAAPKCSEKMLHDKTLEVASSKPMEKPFLIQKVKLACPGHTDAEYERMLQVVAGESLKKLK